MNSSTTVFESTELGPGSMSRVSPLGKVTSTRPSRATAPDDGKPCEGSGREVGFLPLSDPRRQRFIEQLGVEQRGEVRRQGIAGEGGCRWQSLAFDDGSEAYEALAQRRRVPSRCSRRTGSKTTPHRQLTFVYYICNIRNINNRVRSKQ